MVLVNDFKVLEIQLLHGFSSTPWITIAGDKGAGLKCKDAGEDSFVGSELARRIAKTAPIIGGSEASSLL
ncbi:UNVERIFIED_CONTAM: hypothetical protein Sindi_1663800, partial [Sesamum indicum]